VEAGRRDRAQCRAARVEAGSPRERGAPGPTWKRAGQLPPIHAAMRADEPAEKSDMEGRAGWRPSQASGTARGPMTPTKRGLVVPRRGPPHDQGPGRSRPSP
jgi:hypothetical protein